MTTFDLTKLSAELKTCTVPTAESGVSFARKGLTLDTEEQALVVVEAIEACPHLEYLDFQGNTIGPEAAEAIADALEKKGSSLKRALWNDMFTRRSKMEIPRALKSLGTSLSTAGARLTELDLSNNALGPIGVGALGVLMAKGTCHTLSVLRLENCGLGTIGGLLLSTALKDCYDNSVKVGGSPLPLKVFIAGRNRLENEGAKALGGVFKKFKSLEEVSLCQNGIYHAGISAIAAGLSHNPGLRILDLNDNTVGSKGARALAKALPNFRNLEELNLGDCLLKTKGCLILTEALGIANNHPRLTKLNLSYNEIFTRAATPLVQAMLDKEHLKELEIGGNSFGPTGYNIFVKAFERVQKVPILKMNDWADDELDEESEEETDDENDEDDELTEENEEKVENKKNEEEIECVEEDESEDELEINSLVSDFLRTPSPEKLLLLPNDVVEDFVKHAKNISNKSDAPRKLKFANEFVRIIIRVSSFYEDTRSDVRSKAETLTDILYARFCAFAKKEEETGIWDNALMEHLGLIKSEDKQNTKNEWPLGGSFKALEQFSRRDYFLQHTIAILRFFLSVRENREKRVDPYRQYKDSLQAVLDRIQNNKEITLTFRGIPM